MKGHLTTGHLIDLLHEIHGAHSTGVLHLIQGSRFRGLRFRAGEIVQLISSVPEEHMGDVLLRAFAEGPGSYTFEDAEPAWRSDQGAPPFLSEMLLDVARRLEDPEAIRYAVGDLERVLAPTPEAPRRAQEIALTPSDAYVLSRLDGATKLAEILDLAPLPRQEALRSLFALACAGLVFPTSGTKAARRPRLVPEARREKAQSPPPSRPASPMAPSPPEPLVAVSPALALDPDAEALQADRELVAAERLLAEGHYWDAIQALDGLIPRLPTRTGRRAQVALARAYRKNPKWLKSAEEQLLAVVHAEPGALDALLELASLYEEKGFKSRAGATYHRVLLVDGANRGARAALRRLEPGPTGVAGKSKKVLGREEGVSRSCRPAAF